MRDWFRIRIGGRFRLRRGFWFRIRGPARSCADYQALGWVSIDLEVECRFRLGFECRISLEVVLNVVLKVRHRVWYRGTGLGYGSGWGSGLRSCCGGVEVRA